MAANMVKFCTAALAGSLVGIAYERMPPTSEWPDFLKTVSAATSILPKLPFDNDISASPVKVPPIDSDISAQNMKNSAKFGLPSTDNLRVFNDFILSYDRRLRSPTWVIEHLTPEKLKARNADRKESNFHEDKAIHEYFRAKLSDFRKSGYDRGHMAAAGNHKRHQDDLDQTFALSNISPQQPRLNQGAWERLERYVRFRTNRAKNLYVVSGPLYLPMKARDGNLYVTYRVLGDNHVSVPTHYFKVILVEEKNDRLSMEAFIMPNDNNLPEDAKIDDFRVDIDRLDIIERASGAIFFGQIPRSKVDAPKRLVGGFKDEPEQQDRRKLPAQ